MTSKATLRVGKEYLYIGQTYNSIKESIRRIFIDIEFSEEQESNSIILENDSLSISLFEGLVEGITIREDLVEEVYFEDKDIDICSKTSDIKNGLVNELNHEYTIVSSIEKDRKSNNEYGNLNYVSCIHNILDTYEYIVEDYSYDNSTESYRYITIQKINTFLRHLSMYVDILLEHG